MPVSVLSLFNILLLRGGVTRTHERMCFVQGRYFVGL